MGSTLLTLRTLLSDQLDTETPTSGSDPSKELLNTYINNSIRKITRRDEPRELMLSTPVTANIVQAANTVTIPTTVFVPQNVYYKTSGGTWRQLKQIAYKDIIQSAGPNNFFDTTDQGDPTYYAVQGTSLIFNKHFSRTATAAINILGIAPPTVLSADIDVTELPTDYNLLVIYESSILFAQRDDDEENIARWMGLAKAEKAEIDTNLDTDNNQAFVMDPMIFSRGGRGINNPSTFFGGG